MKLIVKVFPEITIKSAGAQGLHSSVGEEHPHRVARARPRGAGRRRVDNIGGKPRSASLPLREMIERLRCTPGIAHCLEVHEYPLGDLDDIVAVCKAHYAERLPGRIFAVRCKRAGKHPFSSMDVERHVGSQLRQQCGAAGISLKAPEIEVRMEIRDQRLFVVHEQHDGIGGYPLGALEQTGADVRWFRLHRCRLPDDASRPDDPFLLLQPGGRAHELGVMEVAHYLWKKYGSSHRVLFISVPFEEVVGEILQKVDNSQMGVVLKRMMLRASTEIAERLHIDALVTGEAISVCPARPCRTFR